MIPNNGLHHYHKRKRVHEKIEKHPDSDKWKKFIDQLIYPIALFAPIMTIPQVLKIWIGKDATGVSVISWVAYLMSGFLWLIYGFIHKEKPIILTNILWIFLEIIIIFGVFLYA